jgi:PAS domain-containing protein
MKNERIQALVVTFLAAGIFYLIDRIVLDVTIAPLLGVLLLFALSLIFRPSSLALVLAILLPYVIFSLTQAPSFNMEHKESVQRLIVRSGSFFVAGMLAMLASHFRCKVRKMLAQLTVLLESLPIPIVLSEPGGLVVWCNQAAQQICGSSPLVGKRYTEALPFDGRPIHYRALFEGRHLDAEMRDAVPGRTLKFIPIHATGRRLLATVIFPNS